ADESLPTGTAGEPAVPERKRRRRGSRGRGGAGASGEAQGVLAVAEPSRLRPLPDTPARDAPRDAPRPEPRTAREGETLALGVRELQEMVREIVSAVPDRATAAYEERKLAVFCDLENVAIGSRDSGITFDINLVLERLLEKGKIIVKK